MRVMSTVSSIGNRNLELYVLRIKNGGVGKEYMALDDLTDLR